jgi:glycosidase
MQKPLRILSIILTAALFAAAMFTASCASGPVSPDRRPGWISREARDPVVPIEQVSPGEVAELLQVPSPDWRDQVIYFVMTDRFDDGDPANSDQGAGEYDPGRNSHYSGGDLRGITDNIDYIKGMGATAVWITPPVANQWYDYMVNYGGYHGYWGEHFKEVDLHMGSLDDYRMLSASLHKNGMYLIQDIVPNHTGNFFTYDGISSRARPEKNYVPNETYVPSWAPRQYPFNLNDPRDPEAVETAAYHWTGPITNYNVQSQLLNYQLSDLDDINTENELVRDVLRDSYAYWIREVGVDGFRIDTVKYIPVDFFNDFHYSDDPDAPGIIRVAESLGKENFVTFGEAWIGSEPYNDDADIKMAAYMGSEDEPALISLLNFSLNQEIRSVFAAGAATDRLHYRMNALEEHYGDPNYLYTFIDNHDMDRFMAIADEQDMELALLYIFTAPGVPIVYYGTEQYFTETRQAMFANGFASGGRDWFEAGSPGYRYLASLARLRAEAPEFRRGEYRALGANGSGPGLLAYSLEYQGEQSIIIMNTAPYDFLATDLDTGLDGAYELEVIYSLRSVAEDLQTDDEGRVDLVLPPSSAIILKAGDASQSSSDRGNSISVSGLADGQRVTGNMEISGSSDIRGSLLLVIDGNLTKAYPVENRDGRFTVTLPAEKYANGMHNLAVIGFDDEGNLVSSPRYSMQIDLAYSLAAQVSDPVGDDAGPQGRYRYPLHESFAGQMDIEQVAVYRAGTNLRLEITTAAPISTSWNPINGFDHVYFYVYFNDPEKTGVTVLPFQNSSTPEGFDWDVMMMVGGWNASLYSAQGAGADNYGTALSSAIGIEVDETARSLIFTLEGAGLDYPENLDGFEIYITTWDYDGLESANRLLQAEPDDYIFGGGDYSVDPLIMDDVPPITIQ